MALQLVVGVSCISEDAALILKNLSAADTRPLFDEDVDTATNGSALYIAHGSVKLSVLKADVAGTAPDAALLELLQAAGIYPE